MNDHALASFLSFHVCVSLCDGCIKRLGYPYGYPQDGYNSMGRRGAPGTPGTPTSPHDPAYGQRYAYPDSYSSLGRQAPYAPTSAQEGSAGNQYPNSYSSMPRGSTDRGGHTSPYGSLDRRGMDPYGGDQGRGTSPYASLDRNARHGSSPQGSRRPNGSVSGMKPLHSKHPSSIYTSRHCYIK